MGVPLITALIIQENGAEVAVGVDESTGKYGFEIYSIIREKYRPHLTSRGIYNSEDIAMKEGKKVLDSIKFLDLSGKRKELSSLLGKDKEIIQKIVDNSKK